MCRRSACSLIVLAVAAGCRRDAARLDDAPRIAYGAKPAVVRINAYATARFHYPTTALMAIARDLGVEIRNVAPREAVVESGAGGSGSGFIIRSDGFVLTSGHVIAPTRDPHALERDLRRNGAIAALVRHFALDVLRSRLRGGALERSIRTLAEVGRIEKTQVTNSMELSDGESLTYEVVRQTPGFDERGPDLALLRVARLNLPSLPLGDSSAVRVGDSIWTVGYPAVASSSDEVIGGWLSRDSDLEATFNGGTVTAIRRDLANREILQSDVAIYRGNSGGPAVDRSGSVVGVAAWGHSEAEQIKFLVPVNVAKAFLREARVEPAVDGEFNRSYRDALEAAGRGDWVRARRSLDGAARLFPNSPDLARFASEVNRALRETPWREQHPIAAALLSLLALGVAAVAVVGYLRYSFGRRLGDAAGAVETVLPSPRDSAFAPIPQKLGRFTILNGERAGERLGLGGTGIRIGRERAICEIVLENPKISRLHAEVVAMDGKVLLIDRNSSNGTYVNDQKIERRFLRNGDIIYFGGRNAIAVAFHV